jgi:hypothetical protein
MTGIQRTTLAPTFLALTCLAASACSPYVYETEITTFREGVDESVEAYEELVPVYTEWAINERSEELFAIFENDDVKPSTTDACNGLRRVFEDRFASQGDTGAEADLGADLITGEEYSACHVTPLGREVSEAGPTNLALLGSALKAYAGGLAAITTAGDEATLQTAFADFNTSAKSLLESLNAELNERQEPKYLV